MSSHHDPNPTEGKLYLLAMHYVALWHVAASLIILLSTSVEISVRDFTKSRYSVIVVSWKRSKFHYVASGKMVKPRGLRLAGHLARIWIGEVHTGLW
jgi:hypothetical protein